MTPSLASFFVSVVCVIAVPLYRNSSAPIDERVADLLSLMTLQEKVNQLIIPWPSSITGPEILERYGNMSVGALYAYAVGGFANISDHYDSLSYLQGQLLSNSRLGIPVTYISETLHSSDENGTAFPNPTLLASTWDVALVQQIGAVIGLEARTSGIGRGFAPVLQVATDPRFGRYEEAFGEDPYLVGRFGLAMTLGQQGPPGGPDTYIETVQTTSLEAKHAVAYAYSGRDWYRADISDRTLMDVYCRGWKAVIQEGGLRGLMVTHPEVNGLPMHGNGPILTGMLRGILNASKLFFSADAGDVQNIGSFGITSTLNESAVYALTAGLDQELSAQAYPTLVDSVERGLVAESYVDAAVTRLLREKFALHLFDGPEWWYVNGSAARAIKDAPAHRALAYKAAIEGAILLQNEASPVSPNGPNTPILPLQGVGSAIKSIALVGPNGGCAQAPTSDDCPAASAYRGGYCNGGSHTVTLYEALLSISGISVSYNLGANITNWLDESEIAPAVAAASAADVTIAVVGDTTSGYGKGTCAEGLDTDTIDLPGSQLALLAALAALNKPLIVVLINGRPATFGAGTVASVGPNNALLSSLPAVLVTWRPGEEGGNAIRDLLLGVYNPSGRLTQNWVRTVGAIRGPANPYFQTRGAGGGAY